MRTELLPHVENLAPILIEAGRSKPINKLTQLLEIARRLAVSESRFEAMAFLQLVSVLRARGTDNSVSAATAHAHLCFGDVAAQRDDLDGAQTHLERARDISVQIGSRLGEANALQALGDLALCRYDLDGAKSHLERARDISVQIGRRLGEANALRSLGDLALRRDDLDGAKAHLERARDISAQIGERLGEANALRALGHLALLRDDLDGAKSHLERARDISAQIGERLGEANALRSLGDLALRRDDLDAAKAHLERARDISVQIGRRLGEANVVFVSALVETRNDSSKAEKMFADALKSYQALGDAWGIAHSSLRLAQLAAVRGDPASLAAAARNVLAHETSHPSKRGGPGWRAFCLSLAETDASKREAWHNESRTAWTSIGALGLVRDYLDFKIELKP
jgi:tetratricopeptide (TPR) repeat protein